MVWQQFLNGWVYYLNFNWFILSIFFFLLRLDVLLWSSVEIYSIQFIIVKHLSTYITNYVILIKRRDTTDCIFVEYFQKNCNWSFSSRFQSRGVVKNWPQSGNRHLHGKLGHLLCFPRPTEIPPFKNTNQFNENKPCKVSNKSRKAPLECERHVKLSDLCWRRSGSFETRDCAPSLPVQEFQLI